MRRLTAALLLALLAACGGGGGDDEAPVPDPPGALNDPNAYSSQPEASLPGAVEAVATTKHQLRLGGSEIAYTASAGHLIAREPLAGAAQASVFHVAYTADDADPAMRPVTFFYNGGPGSSAKSSAVRAKAYTAATGPRKSAGIHRDATGKFS